MKWLLFLCLLIGLPSFHNAAHAANGVNAGCTFFLLSVPSVNVSHPREATVHHPSFFRRLAMAWRMKKAMMVKSADKYNSEEADRIATGSLVIGIAALASALIPWYTLALAIPLGIIAISLGAKARKMGSQQMTGKGLGIAALLAVAIWISIVAISIAMW